MKRVARRSGMLRVVSGCALLGALALIPSAAFAREPSRIIMLGDSSADSGTYDGDRPVNEGNLWIETVARHLRLPMSSARSIYLAENGEFGVRTAEGSNYAASGASVSEYFPFPYITFSDQVRWLKEDHASIDKDALVFLQFDSNDAAYSFMLDIPYDPQVYANEYVANVHALKEMGARNIVAMGDTASLLPEGLYSSPEGGMSPEVIEAHRENMLASRAALWPQLQAAGVYVVDLDKVAADTAGNLSKYGFSVGPEGWMTDNGPNDGHVFTYDGHYTSAMQDIFAAYTIAQLRARDQFGYLLTNPMMTMARETAALEPHLGASAFKNGNGRSRAQGEIRTYDSYVHEDRRQSARGGFDDGLDTNANGGAAGLDIAATDKIVVGVVGTYRHDHGTFGNDTGSFSRDTTLITTYGTMLVTPNTHLNAALSYGHLDYGKVTRTANLGPAYETASGETEGAYWAARVGGGHNFALGNWTLSANAALTYEKTSLDGYNEQGAVLAIAYGDSSYDNLRGSLGLHLALTGGNYRFRPYGGASIDYDFFDKDVTIKAGPNSGMLVNYDFERPHRTTGRAVIGGTYDLTSTITLDGNVSLSQSLEENSDTGVAARVGLRLRH